MDLGALRTMSSFRKVAGLNCGPKRARAVQSLTDNLPWLVLLLL